MTADSETILVVDDDESIADLYARWLDTYNVLTAYGGEEALELLDSSIDIVVLDRRMPAVSGDDVLETLDARDLDCLVVIVTAVDPEFDVVELTFDEYVTKPVLREELQEAVETVRARDTDDDLHREYHSLLAKRAVLESEMQPSELKHDEDYIALCDRLETIAETLEADEATLGQSDEGQ